MPQATPNTPTPTPHKLVHKHPGGQNYLNTCKACRADDAARSAPDVRAVREDDIARTTFLIPETPYDNSICRAYLAEKYPEAGYIHHKLDLAKLGGWAEGEQIVVVRRDTWPKQPGPGQTREKDEEGKWQYNAVPPETYLNEIVEMAPIDVRATMVVTKADRFTKSALDIKPLIARLAELMCLPYRIDMPRDDNDTEMNFVHA